MKKIIFITILALLASGTAHSHGGGLNANDCHKDNSQGGIVHCHPQEKEKETDSGNALLIVVGVVVGAFILVQVLKDDKTPSAIASPEFHKFSFDKDGLVYDDLMFLNTSLSAGDNPVSGANIGMRWEF